MSKTQKFSTPRRNCTKINKSYYTYTHHHYHHKQSKQNAHSHRWAHSQTNPPPDIKEIVFVAVIEHHDQHNSEKRVGLLKLSILLWLESSSAQRKLSLAARYFRLHLWNRPQNNLEKESRWIFRDASVRLLLEQRVLYERGHTQKETESVS